MGQHHEVHVYLPDAGHVLSTDCWCEPSPVYWQKNDHNELVQIVEHNDETPIHHAIILVQRAATLNLEEDTSSDSPWVSRVLNNPTDPPNMTGIMVPAKRKEKPDAS